MSELSSSSSHRPCPKKQTNREENQPTVPSPPPPPPSSTAASITIIMNEEVEKYWMNETKKIEEISSAAEFRNVDLPVARVKKIMKLDEDVKLVSAESPILLAKASEIFITELSIRSWYNVEESKRRLVRAKDISAALSKSEQFDFLIDILPKEAPQAKSNQPEATMATAPTATVTAVAVQNPVQAQTLQAFTLNPQIQLINGPYFM